MSDVHLRALRALVAVADAGSITAASEEVLYVSQPAVSRTLRRLEREVGVPLLEQQGRGVALTDAAHTLVAGAREILEVYDRAVADARAISATVSGTLRVGLQTPVGRGLLPAMTRRLRESHPDLRIDLVQVPWEDDSAGLRDGSVDVTFAWLPLPEEGLDHEVVVTEERWVALPTGHPAADQDRVVFADIAAELFVALPPSAGRLRAFWLADDVRTQPARIGTEAASAAAAFEAVANGLGIALVAEGQAELSPRPDVVFKPVDGLSPARMAVAWRADDTRQEVAALVAATMM